MQSRGVRGRIGKRLFSARTIPWRERRPPMNENARWHECSLFSRAQEPRKTSESVADI